jgi:hypothetical protein
MDLRRKIILQDLQTMVEACKAIFGRVSHDGSRSIPIALRIKIADEVVTAARNGNYSRDDIIAAVAHEMTKLLPATDPSPRSRQPR